MVKVCVLEIDSKKFKDYMPMFQFIVLRTLPLVLIYKI